MKACVLSEPKFWHTKDLVVKLVWIEKNESSCSQIWRVRPPVIDLRGLPVVEISANIQIHP